MKNKHKSKKVCTNGSNNSNWKIEPLLPIGKENAISTEELKQVFGCSAREIRAIVSKERNEGALICSSTQGGYFKAGSRAELQEFYNTLQSQAISIYKALRHTKKALDETDGQISIDDIKER